MKDTLQHVIITKHADKTTLKSIWPAISESPLTNAHRFSLYTQPQFTSSAEPDTSTHTNSVCTHWGICFQIFDYASEPKYE